MSQAKQVFISYSKEDKSFANRLAGDLKRLSVKVWIATESIRASDDWVKEISRGLEESSHVVTVLTPSALESDWVKKETNVAISMELKGQLRVIPLDVEPCNPPSLWTSYQMISFREDYANGLSQLAAALGFFMEPEKPKPRPEPSPELRPKTPPIPQLEPMPQRISMSQILERVRWHVSEQMGVAIADFRPETNLVDDLKACDLDQIELVMEFEDEFDIVFKPEESFDWKTKSLKLHTVKDWAAYIYQRMQG